MGPLCVYRVYDGQETTHRAVFRQHYRALYRLASVLLHDDDESKSVKQFDIFLKNNTIRLIFLQNSLTCLFF